MRSPILRVTIKGVPISKANAASVRWSRKLKRCEMYIPDKFMEYEDLLKQAAQKYMCKTGKTPFLTGPVSIKITYFLKSKRKKDLLNLPKTTCDALNDVFYKDDCQIVEATCSKRYDSKNPRVVIEVKRPAGWQLKVKDEYWSLPPSYIRK